LHRHFDHLPPLTPLLDALVAHLDAPPASIESWQVQRILGGQNNVLFRATSDDDSIAVKFTRRDARDRAGREFAALQLLEQVDSSLAPVPLLLDRDSYALPVVVQSWLTGGTSATVPTSAEWGLLIDHLRAIHRIKLEQATAPIPPAVLTMTSADDGVQRVLGGWHGQPAGTFTPEVDALVERVRGRNWPTWPQPELTLCRVDPNILNFVRLPTRWASVDWENSGWGDPAFEVADLLAHPAYTTVPAGMWKELIVAYSLGNDDQTLMLRIRTYLALMLADWAVFFARKAHEYAQGRLQTPRLVDRPASWYATLPQQAAHYLAAAKAALASLR
jgi:aminoglycoside phosphotransferase (APT) family kinase protein